MTQVVLNISNKKKWNALKAILQMMNIDYITQESADKLSAAETELLKQAQSDIDKGQLNAYTSTRDILGR